MNWNEYQKLVQADIVYSSVVKGISLHDDPYPRFYKLMNLIERFLPRKAERSLSALDLGCHNTQFMSLLRTKFNFNVSGVDDWKAESDLYFEGKYYQGNIDKQWNIPENSYDLISALEVIEHMIDTDLFLKQCNSHLRLGGYLAISTPNINSLRNRLLVPLGAYPTGLEYKNELHHVRLYNPRKLKEHLLEHNFKSIKIIGVNFFPFSLRKGFLRKFDSILADAFPSLCNNFIVIAEKTA
jgi:2-polyprenyl-3-methyl-5-hydroxy-6-metoxy-1,4-benzoquinol methylase